MLFAIVVAVGLFAAFSLRAADSAADTGLHAVEADDNEIYYDGPMRDVEGASAMSVNQSGWLIISGGVRGQKYTFKRKGYAETVRRAIYGGDEISRTWFSGISLKWLFQVNMGLGENQIFHDVYESEDTVTFIGGQTKKIAVRHHISPSNLNDLDSVVGFSLRQSDGCGGAGGGGCTTCSSSDAPGVGGAGVNSIDVHISLGPDRLDGLSGHIDLHASNLELSTRLYRPEALDFTGIDEWDSSTGWGVISSPLASGEDVGQPRQVRLPGVFVDIQRTTSSGNGAGYELRFYHPADIGSYDAGTGLYTVSPSLTPYNIWKFENVSNSAGTKLSVKKNYGASNEAEYYYDYSAPVVVSGNTEQGWTMATKAGSVTMKSESVINVSDANGSVIASRRTIKNGSGVVEASINQELNDSGKPLAETVAYGDSALARTTTYEYDGDQQVTKRQDWTGNWTYYNAYDSRGRATQWVEQYKNNPYTGSWPDSVNRMHEFIDSSDCETNIETLAGVVVARSWKKVEDFGTLYEGENNRRKITESVATDLTIGSPSWSDVSNLKTVTYLYDEETPAIGRRKNAPYLVVKPDGLAVLTKYFDTTTTINGETVAVEKTETYSGAPSTTAVTDYTVTITAGTKTVEERTVYGQRISRTVTDIATGTVIEDELASAFDAFGRVTETLLFGGLYTENRSYACCGLESETNRDGVRTEYTYDPLGRVKTRTDYADGSGDQPPVTREFFYDSLDRKIKTLIGPAGSQLIEEETGYDLAGNRIWTKDGLGRKTKFTEAKVGDYVVQTATLPDGTSDPSGCIQVEKRYQDGRPYESISTVTPTITRGTHYDYATDSVGNQSTTQTPLDNGTLVTSAAITRWTDAAGREWKTISPSPTESGTVEEVRYYATPAETSYRPGQLYKITRSGQPATLYTYDSQGRVESEGLDLNSDGVLTTTGGIDRLTEYGYTYSNANGSLSTLVKQWVTATDYLTSEAIRTFTDAQAASTAPGELAITITRSADASTATVTISESNPTKGTITETILKHGRRATSRTKAYDGAHAVLNQASYAYNVYGRLSTQTDLANGATTYTYDDAGRIASVTTPDPDPVNNGVGQRPQTLTYAYVDLGSAADYGRRETISRRYGGVNGTVVEQTVSDYYPTGELRLTYGATATPARYAYDFAGRVKTLTTWQDFNLTTGIGTGSGATTTWNYNDAGLLKSKRYADNKGPDYAYWPSGNLKTRTWARSVGGSRVVTTYGYTAAGDLETIAYSDGLTPGVTYGHDRSGRLETTLDASGLLTRSYEPSSLRLSGEVYTGTGLLSGHSLMRSYDPVRKRPQGFETDTGYTVGYGYDDGGRLDTVNEGFHLAKYDYKASVGSVEAVTVKRSGVERAHHGRTTDALGRITQAKTTTVGVIPVQRDYGYNDVNQRTQIAHEDTRAWSYGYDALGQVTSAEKRLADLTTTLPGYSFGYTFDTIGNRIETTINGRTATYIPDVGQLNQYASRTVVGALDVRGEAAADATVTVNGLATTRTGKDFYREVAVTNTSAAKNTTLTIEATKAGPPVETATETRSAFLPLTPESYVHDDDGNLTQDGRWVNTWDGENRLIAQETRSDVVGQTTGLVHQRLEYAYDAQGRRIHKVVKLWDVSGGAWTTASDLRFIYDGWNLVGEIDAVANTVTRTHVWGLDLSGTMQGAGGVGGLLWSSASGNTYTASADANGNIVAYINTATLAISGRADYGAFGEAVVRTGVTNMLPFGFSSKYTDSETGQLYYGFRSYEPITGRWLSRDPIEEQGGVNLYAVAANNAVNKIDHLGLSVSSWIASRYARGGNWQTYDYADTGGEMLSATKGEVKVFFDRLFASSITLTECWQKITLDHNIAQTLGRPIFVEGGGLGFWLFQSLDVHVWGDVEARRINGRNETRKRNMTLRWFDEIDANAFGEGETVSDAYGRGGLGTAFWRITEGVLDAVNENQFLKGNFYVRIYWQDKSQ